MSILYSLKGAFTVLNLLIFLLLLAWVFSKYKKITLARTFLALSVVLFLLFSTAYVPGYFAGKLEKKYSPYEAIHHFSDSEKVLIHVLGSGYVLDKRLPPTAQLGWCALGRLTEAIRIHRLIKNSVIVCSGYSPLGLETQAQVAKKAAIVLGVEPDEIATLDLPSTTQEEAIELGRLYDKKSPLIVVTDAMHMPRAIKLFTAQGFRPLAAPTNYKVTEGPVQNKIKWWPSFENMDLMDYVVHEFLGNLKISLH